MDADKQMDSHSVAPVSHKMQIQLSPASQISIFTNSVSEKWNIAHKLWKLVDEYTIIHCIFTLSWTHFFFFKPNACLRSTQCFNWAPILWQCKCFQLICSALDHQHRIWRWQMYPDRSARETRRCRCSLSADCLLSLHMDNMPYGKTEIRSFCIWTSLLIPSQRPITCATTTILWDHICPHTKITIPFLTSPINNSSTIMFHAHFKTLLHCNKSQRLVLCRKWMLEHHMTQRRTEAVSTPPPPRARHDGGTLPLPLCNWSHVYHPHLGPIWLTHWLAVKRTPAPHHQPLQHAPGRNPK